MSDLPIPKSYAAYVEAMKALPVNQQWVMFTSAMNDKAVMHDYPLGSIDELELWMGMTESGELRARLNCNDAFYAACSDAEPVNAWDVQLLVQAKRHFEKWTGVMEWASRKRGERLLRPTGITDEQWAEFMQSLDALFAENSSFFPWWHEDD